MGQPPLEGMRVAVLVGEAFELKELTEPREALEQAGAHVTIIGPEPGRIPGINPRAGGEEHVRAITVDVPIDQARPDDYDALLLPGGAGQPDPLCTDPRALDFVRWMDREGRPIAAAGYGPLMLAAAEVVRGRTLCGDPKLRTTIEEAGGTWSRRPIVVDRNWVCSSSVRELPIFVHTIIQEWRKHWQRPEQQAA